MASSTSTIISSAPSSSPSHISRALNAFKFFTSSSQVEFKRESGGLTPFHSILSIHLFVHWLSSLPDRKILSSDLFLVAWAVKGLPAGLGCFLQLSLGWEKVPEERINLEYLLWHLEMWRSVFSSTILVEHARKKAKEPSIDIVDWYARAVLADRNVALRAAGRYWHRFSGRGGMYFS